MNNSVIIYTPSLARHLFKKGFKLIDFKADKKNYVATVFFFDASEEIKKIIKDYKIRKKETKERNEEGMFIEGKRDNPENK